SGWRWASSRRPASSARMATTSWPNRSEHSTGFERSHRLRPRIRANHAVGAAGSVPSHAETTKPAKPALSSRRELVPRRGLEPPRSYPLVPETSASTNSATWAFQERKALYIKNTDVPSGPLDEIEGVIQG